GSVESAISSSGSCTASPLRRCRGSCLLKRRYRRRHHERAKSAHSSDALHDALRYNHGLLDVQRGEKRIRLTLPSDGATWLMDQLVAFSLAQKQQVWLEPLAQARVTCSRLKGEIADKPSVDDIRRMLAPQGLDLLRRADGYVVSYVADTPVTERCDTGTPGLSVPWAVSIGALRGARDVDDLMFQFDPGAHEQQILVRGVTDVEVGCGLQAGDRIVNLNGRPISVSGLWAARDVRKHLQRNRGTMDLLREGKAVRIYLPHGEPTARLVDVLAQGAPTLWVRPNAQPLLWCTQVDKRWYDDLNAVNAAELLGPLGFTLGLDGRRTFIDRDEAAVLPPGCAHPLNGMLAGGQVRVADAANAPTEPRPPVLDPQFVDGKLDGIRINRGASNAFLQELQPGDVVVAMDGEPIKKDGRGYTRGLARALREGRGVLTVRRGEKMIRVELRALDGGASSLPRADEPLARWP
ncbi:MAG: hypothetical protein AB2A00_41265, partial [Myxococcota bacterium]